MTRSHDEYIAALSCWHCTVKPGERFRLGRKLVLAKRRMKREAITHILEGGGKYRMSQLVLPVRQAE